MNLVTTDLLPFLYLLPFLAVFVGFCVYLELYCSHSISGLLKLEEWKLLAKLIVIILLLAIIIIGKIALDFPSESFLYGRF